MMICFLNSKIKIKNITAKSQKRNQLKVNQLKVNRWELKQFVDSWILTKMDSDIQNLIYYWLLFLGINIDSMVKNNIF